MGVRGRKPKPAHLRLIEGNPGKRRISKTEWRPPKGMKVPEPPDYLSDEAAAEWRRVAPDLVAMGCLHPTADLSILAAYCTCFVRWRDVEDLLSAERPRDDRGMLAIAGSGGVISNPLVKTASAAMRDMTRYMGELGMTPVARARVGANADASQGMSELEGLIAK